MSLDVFELCTEELQQKLLPVRTKFKEVEDKKVEEAAVRLRYLRCPCKLTSYWLFKIGWSVNQSLGWLISLLVANLQAHHWVSQSESHTVTQSHSHSVTQSLNHTVTQSHSHSVTQSLSHTVTKSHSHSVTQSLSHTVTQSLSHSVTQSLRHSVC